jgi:hypothetical protein
METGREEIDPFEVIDDPTLRVQMQHERRAIEDLVFVTKLSFVPEHKDKTEGFRTTLSCALCRWYDRCGKGQEKAVQLSREPTPLLACLQELRKRLQDRHVFRCAQVVAKKASVDAQAAGAVHTPSVMEAMMLFQQAKKHAQATQDRAKALQDHVKSVKKVALDAEKDNDAAQKELQELQRVMEPKRARTNATTADDHEECDEKSSGLFCQ